MAELSTIARPYAEALFQAVRDGKAGASAEQMLGVVDAMSTAATRPEIARLVGDPKLGGAQLFDLVAGVLPQPLPEPAANLLRLVIENDRLAALPEVARQYRLLKNESEGVADALIESAFPMSEAEVASLVTALGRKFPGIQLKPQVQVDPSLVGGVRIVVGDQVLDGTVKARLAQMQAALTA
ncbi:MAG: synthase subunit delta [Pseudomonadota bacterium]|jgi:F-type H+-transporting ATPase subunit delta